MRTLTLLTTTTTPTPPPPPPPSPAPTLNPDTQTLHLPTGTTITRPADQNRDVKEVGWRVDGVVRSVQFVPDLEGVCVAVEGGDIVLVGEEGGEGEVVGSVESGVDAMEWSPDRELVAIVTGKGTILVMTKDFDLISETPIQTTKFGEDEQIALGWGKKETQFHGSAGKSAAQSLTTDRDPRNWKLSPDDDGRSRVSWRGDGAFFAVSSVDVGEGGLKTRTIRFYNRECVLQSTSEPVPMLEHPLYWKPSGGLVVSTQRLPHRHDVVFFERNGLRHGEFSLREPLSTKVVDLAFNMDSTVLAIWIEREDGGSAVQLWTSSNYYWYLGKEIGGPEGVATFLWDPEEALRIYVWFKIVPPMPMFFFPSFISSLYFPILTHQQKNQTTSETGGLLQTLTYYLETHVSPSLTDTSSKTVAVVDGSRIHLTPFRTSNVPPPMFESAIEGLEGCVGDLTIRGEEVAVWSAGGVRVFGRDGKGWVEKRRVSVSLNPTIYTRQLAWPSGNRILTIASSSDPGVSDHLLAIDLSAAKDTMVQPEKVWVAGAESGILRIATDAGEGFVIVQCGDGSVGKVEEDGIVTRIARFPEPCNWVAGLLLNETPIVFGLSTRNRLFLNDRQVASDATSFTVHNDFLIYTTLSHSIRFVSLAVSVPDEIVVADAVNPNGFDEGLRRVERGGRVVVAVPFGTKLVLQMPRGNLETVHPRAMVLSVVRASIERKDFLNAFLQCRKHRIDLNILVDHLPNIFFENVAEFVKQISSSDYLNLFISSLKEEDVSVTMYPSRLQPAKKAAERETLKVNAVCDAVRGALIALDEVKYITSILSTDAKKSPPDLESAMRRIKSLKATSAAEAEKALKYLIFIADVDRLYNVALGMYDFSLVLLVAQFSQKDPREYLPFLTELRELSTFRQRFRIDDHLERWVGALGHLALLVREEKGEEQEKLFKDLLAYCGKHGLHPEAVKIFKGDKERLAAIYDSYGDYLKNKAKYEEAGLVYYMANEKSKALEAYTACLMWSEALTIAQELPYSAGDIIALAGEMAASLDEAHRYREAATVLIDYGSDIYGGVKCLLKGASWMEAWRLSLLHKRPDLVDEVVKPGVLDGFEIMKEDLATMRDTFSKQSVRIREVRAELERRRLAAESGEYDPILDSIEMMSDTSSMATSRFTGVSGGGTRITGVTSRTGNTYTSHRSKTRRKHERRRNAGKEGGIYEEEFLVNAMNSAVERSNGLRADIRNLVKALMHFGFFDAASEIQTLFSSVLDTLQKGMKGVFENLPKIASSVEEEKIRLMSEAGSLPKPAALANAWPSRNPSSVEVDTKAEASKWAIKFPTPAVFSEESFGFAFVPVSLQQ
ncbi:hypothetical protein HDU67_002020 [Dinochytrium kinnereticum]|nr:hypothetical protein HDU67_002020 [Dinochytrium kinnereticum]